MADRDAITTPSTDIFNFNQLANQTKHLGGGMNSFLVNSQFILSFSFTNCL
jgi:hypothetical protein